MDRSKLGLGGNDRPLSDEELQKQANGGKRLLQTLEQIGNFARSFRTRLRFGELSRAPLRLLRFQLQGKDVECDWIARVSDEWDEDLPPAKRERAATLQALEDSLAVPAWLFRILPEIETATLRIYRGSGHSSGELIILGVVTREEPNINVLSVAMRAKLYGFRFWLNDGIMESLNT